MDLGDGKSDKPDASFDTIERHKGHGGRLVIDEASGIEASLSIISEQKIPSIGDRVGHFTWITLSGGVTEGFSFIAFVEIILIELDFRTFTCRCQIDISSTDRDAIAGETDDAFDVVACLLVGGAEDHNISSLGGSDVKGEFVDDDVFVVFQCTHHGAPFDLEWGDEEGPDPSDNGNDNNDVEDNIEEVEPKAGALLLQEHRRIVGGEP